MPRPARSPDTSPSPKARILEAARAVVAESGWREAQIALIAHRAGVATGSVYRHFESKADLYAQVLAMVSEREVAVVTAIVDSDGPASQRLVDAIYAFALRALRGRRLAYALIAEPCEPEIDLARLRYRAALADQIARLVAEGTGSGEFIDVPPPLAASCVAGAFMEALVGPLSPAGPVDASGAFDADAVPDLPEARRVAQAIASVCARMVFLRAAPQLTLVSRHVARGQA